MKRLFGLVAVVVFLVIVVLPALLARGCIPPSSPPSSGQDRSPADLAAGPVVSLYCCATAEVIALPLETYVAGVVAAEMPASFSLEALKAQAVAARTYVLRRLRSTGGEGCDRDPRADICDDPTHGQAWLSSDEVRRRLGLLAFYRDWPRVCRAADQTRGMVIVCGGSLTDPVYHSTCAGHTEDAAAVWGHPVAYLQGVVCTTDGHSPYSAPQRVVMTLTAVRTALAGAADGGVIPASAGDGPAVVGRSASGRALTLRLDGRSADGVEARRLLNLRSTLFDVSRQGGVAVFSVRGYGHGVGLCQYGADGMARQGYDYIEILKHYYAGVEIRPWAPPAPGQGGDAGAD